MNIIEINNLDFYFGNNQIFSSMNFNSLSGEFILLTGSNSSGKTTFATKLSENEINKVISLVEAKIDFLGKPIVEVSRIHSFVEQALKEIRPDVAESYMDYRNWVKKEAQMNAEVWE